METDLNKIIRKHLKEHLSLYENRPSYMEKVRKIQQALIDRGYYVGIYNANGVFGDHTRDAVIKFQIDSGIIDTGRVGPLTAKKLGVEHLTRDKI